jgi:hypothetical protein
MYRVAEKSPYTQTIHTSDSTVNNARPHEERLEYEAVSSNLRE